MTSSWLPPWLGVVWVVLMAVVAVVHVRHLLTLPDITRAWHAGHVLMALGMVAMFWPGGALLTPTVGAVGRVVLAAAALAAATWAVVDRRRRGRWTTVWPLLAVDLAAMVWMVGVMAPTTAGTAAAMGPDGSMSMGPSWVDAVLALWFAVEAVRWASGALVRSSERDLHLELPTDLPTRASAGLSPVRRDARAGAAGPAGPTGLAGPAGGGLDGLSRENAQRPAPARSPLGEDDPSTRGHAWHGRSLRVTLTIMSAGMAYMFAAMAFGASSMPGGPGGTGGM